jgi:hypothetical protein
VNPFLNLLENAGVCCRSFNEFDSSSRVNSEQFGTLYSTLFRSALAPDWLYTELGQELREAIESLLPALQ